MLCLKKGPNQLGLIFSTLPICFVHFFFINLLLPSGYALHMTLDFYFATHLRDPFLRLPLMTPIRDSCLQPPFATHCFMTTPSCDPITDGQTVSTPQRHLPSIPTLTLIIFFGTFPTTWPPPLATGHHHIHYL